MFLAILPIIGLVLKLLVPAVKYLFARAERREKARLEIMKEIKAHKTKVDNARNKRNEAKRQKNKVSM